MAAELNKIIFGGSMMIFITSGTTKYPVGFSTSAKIDISTDIREISSKDSGNWKDKIPGKNDWKASTEGLAAYNLTGSTLDIEDLFRIWNDRQSVTITFGITSGTYPGWTLDTSNKYFSGSAYISSLSLNSPDNDSVTYSISLEGSGQLSIT
jgi:TP901-1 family phage major tail protein